MAFLQVEGIRKSFGDTSVLKDISFTMEQGEVLSMIGSSGSGKTTLLRCLNFLERPDGGRILMGDEVLFDASDARTLSGGAAQNPILLRAGVPEFQPVSPIHGAAERDAGPGAVGQGAARLQGQQAARS